MRSTGSTAAARRARARVPVRLTGAAVAAVMLAGSLLTTASPAGATQMQSGPCPVVWTGAVLETTALSVQGQLYVYEQEPGATSWTHRELANASPDGNFFETVSMTATSSSVQIAAQDDQGNIWFYQQNDSTGVWSKAQLVGNLSYVSGEGLQTPKIAWTGVPGHTGANSVITAADSSGNVLMWYQNGGGWVQETVADAPTPPDRYFDATPTATDTGIDVMALDTDGDLYSFFQPYGPNPWTVTQVSAPVDHYFNSAAVTWDGTNVDIAAVYNNGSPYPYGADELMFLWKSDSASGWSQEDVRQVPATQPFDYTVGLTYTGTNLLLTATQQMSATRVRLDSWWQGPTFTDFNFEAGPTANAPDGFGAPQMTYTEGSSTPESVVTAPYTTSNYQTAGIEDWTVPLDSSVWTKTIVTSP
jgi:hypothetical protein